MNPESWTFICSIFSFRSVMRSDNSLPMKQRAWLLMRSSQGMVSEEEVQDGGQRTTYCGDGT